MISPYEHWNALYKLGFEVPIGLIQHIQEDALDEGFIQGLSQASGLLQDSIDKDKGLEKIKAKIDARLKEE